MHRDAEQYDRLYASAAPDDGAFYRRLAERCGEPVLELGVGTGRVALALAAAGYDVVGVDNSPAMLARARDKARSAGLRVKLIEMDFVALRLDRRFALALCPYNAINELSDRASVDGFLTSVRDHLLPGGRLAIDTINPDPVALGASSECERHLLTYVHDGATREVYERCDYDAATQIDRLTWIYRDEEGAIVGEERHSVRVFFPQELDALLELHGFVIDAKAGTYDGDPFTSRSPKQIVVCHAEGE